MNRPNKYTMIDKDLLALFKKDPEIAFKRLFDIYYMQLCVYTVQLTDSFEMAEDVVQKVMIYFWEKKYYERVADDLRGYLFSATRNMALADLKRKRFVSMEEIAGFEVEIPNEEINEEEWMERGRQLLEELEKLPQQELLAVKTVILENKKYKEAAEELNISINTLKTHLSRALSKLRKKCNLMLFF